MPERPNIVLIMADDLGFSDIGCYGGEIDTPNIDRLADDGVRFSQFYNYAKCMPTRAALLTGLYPRQVGKRVHGDPFHARNNVTLAETLRPVGYRTLMVGKWHNGSGPASHPKNRGFERFWGLLGGCSNYFNPGLPREGEPAPAHKSEGNMRLWGDEDVKLNPFTPEDRNFYTTDAFTDHALGLLDEYGGDDTPFFLYLPHCAPHFPMQAWPEDIAKYRDTYTEGWTAIRRRRYERLLDLGLIDPRWGLSGADERTPAWDDAENKDFAALTMAVYAAMIDRMDQGIGRVLDKLDELGKAENTLVIFLSDNGGCAEEIHNTPDVPPGPVNSYHTLGAPWANASNTPFRLFKDFDHEGGVSTPMIARWPRVIREGGRIADDVACVLDFMPTFLELAGGEYPTTYDDREVLPMEGRSFASVLRGEACDEPRRIFWEIGGCRAVREGKWKLVTQGPEREQSTMHIPPGHEEWELYDMEADRCELRNLASRHPDRAAEMAALWEAWRARCDEQCGTDTTI